MRITAIAEDCTVDHGELLKRALQGDEAAFVGLLDAFEQPMFAYFRCRRIGVEEAEEMVQQVFATLLEHGGRFDASLGSLRAFVYGIARRVWLKRMQSRHRALRLVSGETVGVAATAEHEMEASERRAAVADAVLALPDPMREVLSLKMHEGLSVAEIATVLSMPANTVKSHLFRARNLLRERLAVKLGITKGEKP